MGTSDILLYFCNIQSHFLQIPLICKVRINTVLCSFWSEHLTANTCMCDQTLPTSSLITAAVLTRHVSPDIILKLFLLSGKKTYLGEVGQITIKRVKKSFHTLRSEEELTRRSVQENVQNTDSETVSQDTTGW